MMSKNNIIKKKSEKKILNDIVLKSERRFSPFWNINITTKILRTIEI